MDISYVCLSRDKLSVLHDTIFKTEKNAFETFFKSESANLSICLVEKSTN